jgi:heme exporter protein A
MSTAPSRLVVQNLGHRFGRRVLFRELAFTLAAGEVLAVVGANGSGKSTLLRILAGVLTPSRGSVDLTLGDAHVSVEDRPLAVGLVAPYLNLYDEFSARENLEFLARARRLPPARVAGALDAVGLAPRADDRFGTFSSGMKQRMRFASALLSEPPLLLLDEPGSNLDDDGRRMVERLVDEQRAAGRLIVLATNVDAEAALCDRRVRVGE